MIKIIDAWPTNVWVAEVAIPQFLTPIPAHNSLAVRAVPGGTSLWAESLTLPFCVRAITCS